MYRTKEVEGGGKEGKRHEGGRWIYWGDPEVVRHRKYGVHKIMLFFVNTQISQRRNNIKINENF